MTVHHTRLGFFVLLLAAAAFYAATFSHDAVGTYNDDAIYILGAQSLRHGHFGKSYLIGSPPDSDRLPGYSLFLVPFVDAISPHWSVLKVLSVLLTLASCVVLWILTRSWFTPVARLAVVTLFAFNADTGLYSHSVMPEPLYILLTLGLILWTRRLVDRQSTWEPWGFGLTLAASVLVRPDGLAMIVATIIALGRHAERRKLLWKISIVTGGVGLLIGIRNVFLSGTASGYVQQIQGVWSASGGMESIQAGLQALSQTLVKMVFIQPFASGTSLALMWSGFFLVVIGILVFRGTTELLEKRPSTSADVVVFYVLAYVVLHACWPSTDDRYLWPILPFVLILLISGIPTLFRSHVRRRAVAILSVVLMCFIYGDKDSFLIFKSMSQHRSLNQQVPLQTMTWLRDHTPEGCRIHSITPAVVYLYGRRVGTNAVLGQTSADWAKELRDTQIDLILFRPFLMTKLSSRLFDRDVAYWNSCWQWAQSDPKRYPLIYRNDNEQTSVYAVRADL